MIDRARVVADYAVYRTIDLFIPTEHNRYYINWLIWISWLFSPAIDKCKSFANRDLSAETAQSATLELGSDPTHSRHSLAYVSPSVLTVRLSILDAYGSLLLTGQLKQPADNINHS